MEGLSLVPFWRVATMNEAPAEAPSGPTIELLLYQLHQSAGRATNRRQCVR